MRRLHLTERAFADIESILAYSARHWGQSVADRYLADLGSAIDRLAANLSLFRKRHDYTGRLLFYSAREHVFVGDVLGGVGYVLAVWHVSMDFIDRLSDLEPELLQEVELIASHLDG